MAAIACLVTAHGFGHATRTVAVLECLRDLSPDLDIRILTEAPRKIFADTLPSFTFHEVDVDVGLVQSSALSADYQATISRLDALLPYRPARTAALADLCRGCSLVLGDIAPWAVEVAECLGVPSVLVENFTWDFIYEGAAEAPPRLAVHGACLRSVADRATYRIATEPRCHSHPCALACGPIFRRLRAGGDVTRRQLPGQGRAIVVITLGGIPQDVVAQPFHRHPDALFVFSGQERTRQVADNVFHLRRNEAIYHPDLIAAADLVVCKAGYSTIAECCQAGARTLCIGREDFVESIILQDYVQERLGGMAVSAADFLSGRWLELLPRLLTAPRPQPCRENGATTVARFLSRLL